jgi:hypothetical protein
VLQLNRYLVIGWQDAPPGIFGLWSIQMAGFQCLTAKDDLKLHEQVRLQNYILAIPRDRILLR